MLSWVKAVSFSVDADECVHIARSTSLRGLRRLWGGQRLSDIESGPNSAHDRKYEVFIIGHSTQESKYHLFMCQSVIFFCISQHSRYCSQTLKRKIPINYASSLLLPAIAVQDLFIHSLDKTLMIVNG